jgi:NADH-quinone oxidoreductase subunit N
MSLLAFVLVCLAGMLLSLTVASYERLARVSGLAGLAVALVAALLINPGDTVTVGEVQLAGSWFGGYFLTALTAGSLLLCLCGLMTGWPERLAPAALAALAGFGVAVFATDPTVALTAAAAATTPAALVAGRLRSTPLGASVGVAELRTLALVVVASMLAAATILNTNWAAADSTFILAIVFLALAGAVAVRSGAVPFHLPAALLSRSGEGLGLVLSLVWVPSGFALVALSWNSTVFGVPGDWIDRSVFAVQAVALATLILGAVGAMLHDEIEEIVAYSIVQDAGFMLLALTARDAEAAQPARLWLLVFVLAKSALVAWAAAMSWSFRTSNLGRLRGWLRRSPILGLALVVIVLATLGWPGSDVYEARAALVRLGLPEPLRFAGLAAMLLSIVYYLRLLGTGLLPASDEVREAAGERPRWAHAVGAPEAGAAGERAAGQGAAGERDLDRPAARRRHEQRPGRSLTRTLRLNGPLGTSALVLATAILAAGVAFGGFGAAAATATGIALDEVAVPLLPGDLNGGGDVPDAEATPEPDATPGTDLTPGADASTGPEDSAGASATPEASAQSSTPAG